MIDTNRRRLAILAAGLAALVAAPKVEAQSLPKETIERLKWVGKSGKIEGYIERVVYAKSN